MNRYLLPAAVALLAPLAAASPLHTEFRTVLQSGTQCLQPDQTLTLTAKNADTEIPTDKCLRIVGRSLYPERGLRGRGEASFRLSEYWIDDCLDATVRREERFSLCFRGSGETFARHAYHRIPRAKLGTGPLTVTLPVVRKDGLAFGKGGKFGAEVEVYRAKAGRHPQDIYDRPDAVLWVPVSEGSGGYEAVTRTFEIPADTVCLLIRIGGESFSGSCHVESPRLIQNGKPLASLPFTPFAERPDRNDYWVGMNLSLRPWPDWELAVNGSPCFSGRVFDRASNIADFFLPLPASVKNGDRLTLKLRRNPGSSPSYPYEVRSAELIETTARVFEIVSVPKFMTAGRPFGVPVETRQPDTTLTVRVSDGLMPSVQTLTFDRPGLHAIPLKAGAPAAEARMTVESCGRSVTVRLGQVLEKTGDDVGISTGDEIYIDKDSRSDYTRFLKWYLSERAGNRMHFRPSYQWSGYRRLNDALLREWVTFLDGLYMRYAWQTEGRTLAGHTVNPPKEVLDTPSFDGKQAHENDGAFYYWSHFRHTGLFTDVFAKLTPYGGIFSKHRPVYTDHGAFVHYDPAGVKDMADGARRFVANLKDQKGESTRHTGPSSLFRYFYQAGYDWLGAEQMYGPEDVTLAALRGASRAYGKSDYGTLHAMQWGSFPFTDPKHARRYGLSLAQAYVNGSSHIHTEEALWLDEYAQDRFSKAGREHMDAQHRILDFTQTHSRRGELLSNIAFVQGRNDAWKCFGRGPVWAQNGARWRFSEAMASFDLLNVMYPNCTLNSCGPNGWFTSMPYGTFDLLPIEAPADALRRYKALVFLGWNTFDADDFARLYDYVFEGGTLVLTAAHINTDLRPDAPAAFPDSDGIVRALLGSDYRTLKGKTVRTVGRGRVIYYPNPVYPANPAIRADYSNTVRKLAQSFADGEAARGWIRPVGRVAFAAWDRADGRTLYATDTHWDTAETEQKAELRYGSRVFDFTVRRDAIENIHCIAGIALRPMANTTEILKAEARDGRYTVTVQSAGDDTVRWADAVTGKRGAFRVTGAGIHTLVCHPAE